MMIILYYLKNLKVVPIPDLISNTFLMFAACLFSFSIQPKAPYVSRESDYVQGSNLIFNLIFFLLK